MHAAPLSSDSASRVAPSVETIIAYIRSLRDTRLRELTRHDDALMDLLEDLYNTVAISAVKREFMKRDLNELRASTLDLVHYSSLITAIKQDGAAVNAEQSQLFTDELKQIFGKYGL